MVTSPRYEVRSYGWPLLEVSQIRRFVRLIVGELENYASAIRRLSVTHIWPELLTQFVDRFSPRVEEKHVFG